MINIYILCSVAINHVAIQLRVHIMHALVICAQYNLTLWCGWGWPWLARATCVHVHNIIIKGQGGYLFTQSHEATPTNVTSYRRARTYVNYLRCDRQYAITKRLVRSPCTKLISKSYKEISLKIPDPCHSIMPCAYLEVASFETNTRIWPS